MANASHLDVLVALGLDLDIGRTKMQEWSATGRSITLRLASKEFCTFVRESEHTVESAKVKTTTKVLGMKSTKETSVISTVKDYYYKVREVLTKFLPCASRSPTKHFICVANRMTLAVQVTYEWEIYLFPGTSPGEKITLRIRNGSLEIRRSAKSAFRPESKTNGNIDVSLDGFFTLSSFAIDRSRVRYFRSLTSRCVPD